MLRVSYVTTVFNKRGFLPQVWAGLAAQQGGHAREFIFVDDGSTDGSAALLRELTAGTPDVLILEQSNAGPALALNRGLRAARGTHVKPLDGDDVLLPWATEALLGALDQAGTEAAFAPALRQPRHGSAPTPPARPEARRVNLLPAALRKAQTTPSSWLATRGALTGPDAAVFIQDYSMELRLAARGPVALLDIPLFATPAAAPGRLSDNQAQTLHDVNAALLRFLRDQPEIPPALRRQAMRRAAGRAWLWASRHGCAAERLRALACHAAAGLGLLPPTPAVEGWLCRPFRASHPIRCPTPAAAPAR